MDVHAQVDTRTPCNMHVGFRWAHAHDALHAVAMRKAFFLTDNWVTLVFHTLAVGASCERL